MFFPLEDNKDGEIIIEDLTNKRYCDCCGADINEIVLDNLLS